MAECGRLICKFEKMQRLNCRFHSVLIPGLYFFVSEILILRKKERKEGNRSKKDGKYPNYKGRQKKVRQKGKQFNKFNGGGERDFLRGPYYIYTTGERDKSEVLLKLKSPFLHCIVYTRILKIAVFPSLHKLWLPLRNIIIKPTKRKILDS